MTASNLSFESSLSLHIVCRCCCTSPSLHLACRCNVFPLLLERRHVEWTLMPSVILMVQPRLTQHFERCLLVASFRPADRSPIEVCADNSPSAIVVVAHNTRATRSMLHDPICDLRCVRFIARRQPSGHFLLRG
jgi:hypothetical protein